MLPEDVNEELIDRMIVPFDSITKHLTDHAAVEEAKLNESKDFADSAIVRYGETSLAKEETELNDSNKKKDEPKAERLIATTQINGCNSDCEVLTTMPESSTNVIMDTTTTSTAATALTAAQNTTFKNENSTKDIDTVEGFQQFADSLIAMD